MGMLFKTRGGVPDMGMGFQTWGWSSRKFEKVDIISLDFIRTMVASLW